METVTVRVRFVELFLFSDAESTGQLKNTIKTSEQAGGDVPFRLINIR